MTTAVISFDGFFGKGVSIINITNKRKGFTSIEYIIGAVLMIGVVTVMMDAISKAVETKGNTTVSILSGNKADASGNLSGNKANASGNDVTGNKAVLGK